MRREWHLNAVLWLLDRAGVEDHDCGPVVGDLLEEYDSGKSSGWLWQQTLALSASVAFKDLRANRLLAARAVLTALVVIVSGMYVRALVTPHLLWAGERTGFWFISGCTLMLAGWLVGVTHRHHRLATLTALVCYAILAKTWVYASHFRHYWSLPGNEMLLLRDIVLTAICICSIFVGALLPPRRSGDGSSAETPRRQRVREGV